MTQGRKQPFFYTGILLIQLMEQLLHIGTLCSSVSRTGILKGGKVVFAAEADDIRLIHIEEGTDDPKAGIRQGHGRREGIEAAFSTPSLFR